MKPRPRRRRGVAFEVLCGVCVLGVEILFGVSAKQCRDHPPKKLFPTQFRVFAESPPKSQNVEFAKSRSRFDDYVGGSHITKVL